jgi:hypothetical protein
MVAREGIDPPTRGFSVPPPHTGRKRTKGGIPWLFKALYGKIGRVCIVTFSAKAGKKRHLEALKPRQW